MDPLLELRIAGALAPVAKDGIVQHSPYCYSVPSASTPRLIHTVVGAGSSRHCTCLAYSYLHGTCKHILAAAAAFDPPAPEPAPESVVVRRIRPGTCVKCGSANSKKDGVRRNMLYRNQKYRCLDCGAYFSENAGLGRTKIPPGLVTDIMQMASAGSTYSGIAGFLAKNGVVVCKKTVCNTVLRLSRILIEYCDRIRPCVSEVWRTDEKLLKALAVRLYLHSMMDDATRFLLSTQMAARKGTDDVSAMFQAAALLAGKIPHLTISDAAGSIHASWKRCYQHNNPGQKHAAHARAIHIAGNMNNNRMERLNREIGRRMRGSRFVPEKAAAAMAERARLFYNFFHRHSGLDGRTPAEAAGILVEGPNKWMTLLQNAHAWKAAG